MPYYTLTDISTGEKSGDCFGIGIEYQSREFSNEEMWNRLFISIGFWYYSYQYYGTAFEQETDYSSSNPPQTASVYSRFTYSYTWKESFITLPILLNIELLQNSKNIFYISFGPSPTLFLKEPTNVDMVYTDYFGKDMFLKTALGFEHSIQPHSLVRISPNLLFGLGNSTKGRRLASAGIEAALLL